MEIDFDETVEYVLKSERKKTNPTVWVIRQMDCRTANMITNEATTRLDNGKLKILLGETAKIQFKNCLVGWKNLIDKKTGKEIPYSEEYKEFLPAYVQTEINEEVNRISTPSETEIKN